MWIERLSQLGDQLGERIVEVLVVTDAEAVPLHDDFAAEERIVLIQIAQIRAFVSRQKCSRLSPCRLVQGVVDGGPVERVDAGRDGARNVEGVVCCHDAFRVSLEDRGVLSDSCGGI